MICKCPFGPRCESNRCCADDNQTIGVRDYRTGEIRKRADWSIFHPWHGPPRVMFLCDGCWREIHAAFEKPLPGIDRPPHASDFWKPSIMEMIRLAAIRLADEDRRKSPPQPVQHFDDRPMLERERRMSPDQWATVVHRRKMMREFREAR